MGVGLLEGFGLCSADNPVLAPALPADPAASRLDLRGHSLFGPGLVPSFPFDSLRLMKRKFNGDYYIDCSCGSSLRRYFRRLRDEPRPALGLPAVPIRQPA